MFLYLIKIFNTKFWIQHADIYFYHSIFCKCGQADEDFADPTQKNAYRKWVANSVGKHRTQNTEPRIEKYKCLLIGEIDIPGTVYTLHTLHTKCDQNLQFKSGEIAGWLWAGLLVNRPGVKYATQR